MVINHNLSAMNAQRQFQNNALSMHKSLEKLSSGLRINKAADDPAGLAVSEKMRAQVRGLNVAMRNTQDGISFLQTAEGWLTETTDLLQRARELSVQSANGIYTDEDRMQIQVEINQLVDEVDRIASQAEFNGLKMLKGGFGQPAGAGAAKDAGAAKGEPNSATRMAPPVEAGQGNPHAPVNKDGGLSIHLGPNMDQRESIAIGDMSAPALGLADGVGDARTVKIDVKTQDSANQSISKLDAALFVVNRQRANIGAYQNRLESATKGLGIAAENLQSAESYIRDTDMAHEMVNYIRSKILTESSGSLLSQANMKPMIVARLLEFR
jgi:flagellin